jgi:hypothetical protein
MANRAQCLHFPRRRTRGWGGWLRTQNWGGEERGRNVAPKSHIGMGKVVPATRISRRPLRHDPHGVRPSYWRWPPRHAGLDGSGSEMCPRAATVASERAHNVGGQSVASAWWKLGCGPRWLAPLRGWVVRFVRMTARAHWSSPKCYWAVWKKKQVGPDSHIWPIRVLQAFLFLFTISDFLSFSFSWFQI